MGNHYKQVRDHHNYDDGDEDDDDVLCDTRAPPRGTLLHAAAGRTRARHRGSSYSSSRSSRYLDHAIHIHVALRANEHDNASPCCSSTCGFRTCRGAIQRQHHRNAACLRTCRGGCRGALSHRRGAPWRRIQRYFTCLSRFFNASIVETLRAFEPLTERVSTDINNTLRAFAPAAEDFARALNETGATLAQAVAPAAEEFRRAVAPAAEDFARFVNETGANVTAALEAVAPNRTANTNPTRRNLLDAEVVAANA